MKGSGNWEQKQEQLFQNRAKLSQRRDESSRVAVRGRAFNPNLRQYIELCTAHRLNNSRVCATVAGAATATAAKAASALVVQLAAPQTVVKCRERGRAREREVEREEGREGRRGKEFNGKCPVATLRHGRA